MTATSTKTTGLCARSLAPRRFANYTPREDHQLLLEQLGEYTRVETTEKLAEFVKSAPAVHGCSASCSEASPPAVLR